jgi:hypothetical protein
MATSTSELGEHEGVAVLSPFTANDAAGATATVTPKVHFPAVASACTTTFVLNTTTLPNLADGSRGHTIYMVPNFASDVETLALVAAGDALLESYGPQSGKSRCTLARHNSIQSYQPTCFAVDFF